MAKALLPWHLQSGWEKWASTADVVLVTCRKTKKDEKIYEEWRVLLCIKWTEILL